MSWRSLPFVKEAVPFVAAFLLMVPQLPAGDRVHSTNRPATRTQPAPVPAVRAQPAAVAISVGVKAPQAMTERVYVDLRGPDGQVRRFPVGGGRDVIQYRQTILRPGEALTILWLPAK